MQHVGSLVYHISILNISRTVNQWVILDDLDFIEGGRGVYAYSSHLKM